MIYFVQCGEEGPIKIGHSTSPRYRVRELQNSSPYDLRLLGVLEGDQKREKELHLQFGELRLKNEWFEPAPELLEFIRVFTHRLFPIKHGVMDYDKIPLEEQVRRWRRGKLRARPKP